MLYELYIDIFFVINAILDGLIIAIVKKVQKCSGSKIRMCLASVVGSGLLSLFICIPFEKNVIFQLFFYMLSYGSMALVAFGWKGRKHLFKMVFFLYVVSLFVNGIFRWLSPNIRHITGVVCYCLVVYGIVCVLLWFFQQIQGEEEDLYTICIYYKDYKIILKGLWDTGNRLCSPYHGKGITVLSYDSMQQYISGNIKECIDKGIITEEADLGNERIFFVPYRTVSNQQEMMVVLEGKKLLIRKNKEIIEYKKPLLGISKNPVSEKDEFQAVLTTNG